MALPFLFGLAVGLVLCFTHSFRLNRRLQRLLNLVSETGPPDTADSSVVSSLRRQFQSQQQLCGDLQAELDAWQGAMDLAPVGYLWIDGDNRLLWCNQWARELLKIDRWQPGELRLLLELVRSYELDRLIEVTRQTQMNHERQWNFYPPHSGQTQSLGAGIPLKGTSLALPRQQVGIFLEDRRELVNLNQARERALSDLTHELRTPLTAIKLVAEALAEKFTGQDQIWLQKMIREINRLFGLVQDWLEISEIHENPLKNLHYEDLQLQRLLLNAWDTVQPLAAKKAVVLRDRQLQDHSLQGDSQRLTQVFINLFDNAIKHSPPGGTIEVTSQGHQDQIQVEIRDRGDGFAIADLPHVFERLYRGDPSRVRENSTHSAGGPVAGQGSGLGLALVKEIIEAHHGQITAHNHPDTGGAQLTITLPPAPPPPTEPKPQINPLTS